MNASDIGTHRAAVIETIRGEHRALGEVLWLFQHLLRDIAADHAQPDFTLLCTALYYIDDFACRCHHPKEEQYLFAAIRRHAPEARTTLTALQSEHQRDDVFVRDLHRLLVLYQAGAPLALKRLIASLDIYAAMLYQHMQREEALLDAFADAVPAEEWRAVAEGFCREDEPLFGPAPQKEFEKLRARIVNMLPTKLRHRASQSDGHD
jgi:hemerythrin-like domain-containing protein